MLGSTGGIQLGTELVIDRVWSVVMPEVNQVGMRRVMLGGKEVVT